MVVAVLPPALELMTAFSCSRDDPALFWQTVQRLLGESMTGADPGRALAELVFGVSALSGILLDQLAQATDRDQAQILANIHRSYLNT